MNNECHNGIAIVGFGALGVLFGSILQAHGVDVRVLCDPERALRYRKQGVFCNGKALDFAYQTTSEGTPLDLVLFATKASGLEAAMETAAPFIGEHTFILSLLNGISSEEQLCSRFPHAQVLWCTAQGMDAVKEGNRLRYVHAGSVTLGERTEGAVSSRAAWLSDWLNEHGIQARAVPDMVRQQWGKLMLNDGVNQVVMVMEGDYGTVQRPGPARDMMLAAMRETQALSVLEGYPITDAEFDAWVRLADSLDPQGKPSMRQDGEARRASEVRLFAGTVLKRAARHGLPTPVNQLLYDRICAMEADYVETRP